jgi:NTP pyrophosphatase (non-canonical NTP hydrolase)
VLYFLLNYQLEISNIMNPDFENLHTSVESHLTLIQTLFDNYQNSSFTKRPPEFFCLELCGEAGELANLEKKKWKGKDIEQFKIDDEAADVFIALANYCNSRGINLGMAVKSKLARIEEKRSLLEEKGQTY